MSCAKGPFVKALLFHVQTAWSKGIYRNLRKFDWCIIKRLQISKLSMVIKADASVYYSLIDVWCYKDVKNVLFTYINSVWLIG